MGVSSISSYANIIFGMDSVYNKKNRDDSAEETGSANRNTGPDTVCFSNEALEKTKIMNDGSSSSSGTADENSQSFLDRQSHGSSKKFQKMDTAELLAFFKSDNFAQDTMGYVKSVAFENKTNSNDEDESSDMFAKAIEQIENTEEISKDNNAVSNGNNSTKGVFVNDMLDYERELKKAIVKIEQEVRNITEAYEQIMNLEGSVEEKTRLSQPVYKELKEKSEELIQLKSQLKNLDNEKFTTMKTA